MAERNVSNLLLEPRATEQVLAAGGVSKKRRIISRKAQAKAQRASTPEPGHRAWTDESEKDFSDGENRNKAPDGDKPKVVPRARTLARTKEREMAVRRTRSAERAPVRDDTEEDFETLRNLHKSREREEEISEAKKLLEDTKPRVKEELKDFVPKEMPPLIEAPSELRKRTPRMVLGQENAEQIPKPKSRKWSTSEEEDEVSRNNRIRPKESERKPRRVRRIMKREKTDASESEGRSSERGFEDSEPEIAKPEAAPEESAPVPEKKTFFQKWFAWRKKEPPPSTETKPAEAKAPKEVKAEPEMPKKWLITQFVNEWKCHAQVNAVEYDKIMVLKNRCMSQLLLLMLYCGFGGMIFRFTEGAFESFYKCGVKRVKRDFIENLWRFSQYMPEEDWKSHARRKLMEFENELHTAHEAGITSYSGQKSWSFLNSVVYCLTVITTIGYGHISPSTTTGRAITIIYAIFGIPMFLILLADFGKLFTRGIKFLWAFVRRLYYTGSCKKVRKTAPVQEMMKGVQLVYDFAKNRRPSQWDGNEHQQNQLSVQESNSGTLPDTPGTPNLSAFKIDDEFNLPISVAITILLVYIFCGATIYWTWEEWSFFESFYFVFISMSTIGFGDFVPQQPAYMMASILYLVFGLALTSMCINVVQEKLSDTFRQASTKIGATIGLRIAEDGTLSAPAELADVNPMQSVNNH